MAIQLLRKRKPLGRANLLTVVAGGNLVDGFRTACDDDREDDDNTRQ